MLAHTILSVLLIWAGAAATEVDKVGFVDVVHEFDFGDAEWNEGCRFAISSMGEGRGNEWDLCPLVGGGRRDVTEGYWIDLAGASECGDAVVCYTGASEQAFGERRNKAVVGKRRVMSGLGDLGASRGVASMPEGGRLNLFLHGGAEYAMIDFICSQDGVDEVIFIEKRQGVHTFSWKTRHGCPISSSTLHLLEEETPNEEDKEDEGETELLDPSIGRNATRKRIGMLILLTGSLLLALAITLSPSLSKQRRTIARYAQSLNPLRIRTLGGGESESRLVRWAEEDMGVHVQGDGEEDVMVNFSEMVDEYIPLKPGSGKAGKKSYGAARQFW